MKVNLFILFNMTIIELMNTIKAKPLIEKDQLLAFDLPPKGFGTFCVTVRYLENCISSPIDKKNKNSYKVTVKKHNDTFEEITGYVYLPNTYKITKAKFTPMIQRNGVLKKFFNKTTTNPCIDLVTSIPLVIIFKINELCVFQKGNYTIHTINPNKWFHIVFGENFMYERVHSVLEYFSSTGNVFCVYAVIDIIPIPKKRRFHKN